MNNFMSETEQRLRSLLEQRRRNRLLLLEQKAIYAQGDVPLRLLNQIVAEEREIANLEAEIQSSDGAEVTQPPAQEESARRRAGGRTNRWAVAVGLLLIVGIGLGLWQGSRPTLISRSPTMAAATILPAEPPTSPPTVTPVDTATPLPTATENLAAMADADATRIAAAISATHAAETAAAPLPTDTATPDIAATEMANAIHMQKAVEATQTAIAGSISTGPSFGPVSFCLEGDIDKVNERRCTTSQVMFTGKIERIYVSWTYKNVYKGMVFPRKWYQDGTLIYAKVGENARWDRNWQVDGVSEYTYLQASGLDSLNRPAYFPPGSYTLELYIGNKLEQVGDFIIQ